MTEHVSMDDLRQERFGRPDFDAAEYEAGREEAGLAIEFANPYPSAPPARLA